MNRWPAGSCGRRNALAAGGLLRAYLCLDRLNTAVLIDLMCKHYPGIGVREIRIVFFIISAAAWNGWLHRGFVHYFDMTGLYSVLTCYILRRRSANLLMCSLETRVAWQFRKYSKEIVN